MSEQQREIGNYILESKLGQGGMGEVYLARHKSLGTQAAIKILGINFSENEEFRERFSREARTQAQLRHPNVAQVLDHVEQDGCWHLIIEYMPNGTVKDAMAQAGGRLEIDRAVTWAKQALAGLAYGHAKNTVHRDIKPANLLLNDRGEVAVTDFGLAIVLGDARLTSTGMAIGTPAYMSPEQVGGEADIDHRTDIYSLGVVLYEMLTGRVPFELKSSFEMFRVLTQPPPPVRQHRPEIAPALEAILNKAMAKAPSDRYQTCQEFLDDLNAYEQGGTVSASTFVPAAPPPSAVVPTGAEMAPTVVAPTGTMPGPPPPPPAQGASAPTATAPSAAVPELPPPPTSGQVPVAHAAPAAAAPVAAAAPPSEPVTVAPAKKKSNAMPILLGLAALFLMAVGVAVLGAAWYFFGRSDAPVTGESSAPVEQSQPGNIDDPQALLAENAQDETDASDNGGAANDGGATNDADGVAVASVAGANTAPGQKKIGTSSVGDAAAADTDAVGQQVGQDRKRTYGGTRGIDVAPETADAAERLTGGSVRERSRTRQAAPPLPQRPRVAVLALGEPTLAGHLEAELERRLSAQGVEVGDERGSMILNDLLRRYGNEVGTADEVVPILRDEGFHVLVLAQVQLTGQRELSSIAGYSYTNQARLRLNTFLLPNGRSLGNGWTEAVEYTDLNALNRAETTRLGDDPDIVGLIRDGWADLR